MELVKKPGRSPIDPRIELARSIIKQKYPDAEFYVGSLWHEVAKIVVEVNEELNNGVKHK